MSGNRGDRLGLTLNRFENDLPAPPQGTPPPPPTQQPTWATAHTAHSQHCGHTALPQGRRHPPADAHTQTQGHQAALSLRLVRFPAGGICRSQDGGTVLKWRGLWLNPGSCGTNGTDGGCIYWPAVCHTAASLEGWLWLNPGSCGTNGTEGGCICCTGGCQPPMAPGGWGRRGGSH